MLRNFRLFIFASGLLALTVTCAPPRPCYAENSEAELFLIAQKAFDDGFYDVATRYIMEFTEKYPQTQKRTQASLLLGQCYFFKGQYLKAYDIFAGLLQAPDYKDATLFWLGETYFKGADYAQAKQQYQQLIDLYPQSTYLPQGYYSLAWSFFNEKDFENAQKTFLEFTKKFPAHELTEDCLFKAAESAYNLHAYENAVQYFKDYITRFTQSTRHDQAYFYMGESFFYQEKFADAAEYYLKAAQISHDDKVILMSKIGAGWCKFKLKEFDAAKLLFDEAQLLSQEKNIPLDDIDLGRGSLFYEMGDFEKALETYDHLLTAFPNSARLFEAHLGRANTLYMLKKYPEAIAEYQLIMEQFKSGPHEKEAVEKAYFGLAWTYLKSGNAEQAIQTFKDVVAKTQDKGIRVSALTQIGDAYQDLDQLDKALETYDQILKDFPDSLYADYIQYREGIALLKMNKIDAATLSFQTLQTNFPKSKYLSDVKYYLGLAYFKKGEWGACRDQLTDFISQLPPESDFGSDAQYILGLAVFNLQDYNEAIKIFQKVIKNYPDQQALVSNCEINIAKCIYNLGDPKEALKRFKIIVYKYPQTSAGLESLLWLGDYYLETSDFNNAVTYYQQLIQDFPGSEKADVAHFGLGQAYQEMGTFDKALSEYKLINESTDQDLSARAKLSIADIFSRDVDAYTAIETYKKITASSPEYTRDAHIKIAEAYQGERDYEKALQSYQDALKSEKGLSKTTDAEIQFAIADILETLGKSREAIDEYLKIPYLYPEESSWGIKAYLRVGRIFEQSEDWENAKQTYTKVIALGSDESKFAQERLDWIQNNVTSLQK